MTSAKGSCGAFFGVALITVVARTTIQIQQNRRLKADDYTLIFGSITFIASTVLIFILIPLSSWFETSIQTSMSPSGPQFDSDPSFLEKLLHYQQLLFAYGSLTWATTFSVKLTFILFFRPMVSRLPKMLLYWKMTFVITLLSFALSICFTFLGCPHFGPALSKPVSSFSHPRLSVVVC